MTDHDDFPMNHFPEDEKFLEHELKEMLEYETNKPEELRDYESIDLLLRKLVKLQKLDDRTQRRTQAGIHVIQSAIRNQYKKSPGRKIRRAVLVACASLILVPNIWSYSVYGMNVLTLTYTYVKGGVMIEFQKNDSGTSQGGIYEDMRRICSENGLEDVMLPSYIPEGFYPSEGFGQVEDNEKYISILFLMKKQEEKIVFTIINYKSPDDVMPYGIPSDEHNIEEKEYHDTKVVISTEDHQYRAVFMKDIKQYGITTYGVDYSLAERIVDSIFN